MSEVKISGLNDLKKSLRQFPVNVQKNIATGAARAAASAIAKEARVLAPKSSGLLKKSIKVTKRRTKDKSIVKFTVAPRRKDEHGYLAHFHEFGTSKMSAHPFMRPAFEKEGPRAIQNMTEYLRKRIDKEIRKAAK